MIKISEEHEALFRECLDHWGIRDQIEAAQEECAEFITAAFHLIRNREGASEEVVEEVADALLTLHEMAVLVGVDKVNDMIDFKVKRVRQRLSKSKQKRGIL